MGVTSNATNLTNATEDSANEVPAMNLNAAKQRNHTQNRTLVLNHFNKKSNSGADQLSNFIAQQSKE